nr:M28 family peptidase [Actinomycetota bacterium]
IAIIWFDGEEWGLLGSHAYVADVQKKGMQFDAVLGFDMNGIAYPAPYCLCVYHGPNPEDAAKAVPLIDYVNYDFLKFPKSDGNPGTAELYPFGTESGVCNCGNNIRNSDESSFASAHYFTLRWTGMRQAKDYPGYHMPWDTIPLMEQVAGGRENLEKGTENTFDSAYYTAIALDHM